MDLGESYLNRAYLPYSDLRATRSATSFGAFASVSTTKLLTVEEALDALRRGGGVEYRAPGVPGT
jgi:hypothetical protein